MLYLVVVVVVQTSRQQTKVYLSVMTHGMNTASSILILEAIPTVGLNRCENDPLRPAWRSAPFLYRNY